MTHTVFNCDSQELLNINKLNHSVKSSVENWLDLAYCKRYPTWQGLRLYFDLFNFVCTVKALKTVQMYKLT